MIQWWSVENTGWSGGISWFTSGGNDTNPLRFKSEVEAMTWATQRKLEMDDPDMYWRVVHTTLERTKDGETVTRKWKNI